MDVDEDLITQMASTLHARPTTAPEIALGSGFRTRPAAPAATPDHERLVTVDPDHYTVEDEIARGGMATIRVARDRRLKRKVALKELRADSTDLRARFEREARLTARLQHPNIVNIHEAGQWPSGEPFYTMKLVAGRQLDQVVDEATSRDQRLALLPHVIAVADALAYAHEQKIIHRDLKPQNVMVGQFGETVVIDWGLATDLADAGDDPPAAGGCSNRVPETALGSVIGTPAYMPPEQAEGDPVDERADVYAIGAILYHVLAGRPPYSASTSWELVVMVRSDPPPPLSELEADVPPDLLAVVDRAMARDPAARYATARGLADDLRRFQSGQLVGAHHYSLRQLVSRWLRRHRAAVSVAAAATLLLVALGVIALQRVVRAQHVAEEQRARAETQQKIAQDRRGDAEDLLGFMVTDLHDQLEPLGRLDVLDRAANKAAAYFDRRADDLSDAELSVRAVALRNLGDVMLAKGRAGDALAEYRAALAIGARMAATRPQSAGWQRDSSHSHEKIGDVLRLQADAAGALAEYRAALVTSAALVAKHPDNDDRQVELWVSRSKVGRVLKDQGDTKGALAEYQAALAIAESLVAKDATKVDWQRYLSVAYNEVGNILTRQGDAAGALAKYRAAQVIAEALAAKDPGNAGWQRDLVVGHQNVGKILAAQGDAVGALAEYRAMVTIAETLAAKDPTNTDRQNILSASYERVGGLLLARGDTAGALVEFKADLALAEKLATKDPSNADYQQGVVISRRWVGDVLRKRGDMTGALAQYREGLGITEKLAASDRTNAKRQEELSVSYERIGTVLLEQRDFAGAVVKFRAALALRESMVAKDSTNVGQQRDLARGHGKLGEALLAQKHVADARAELQLYFTIAQALAAKDPTNADAQLDVATGHERMGDALASRRDKAAQYRAGLAIARRSTAKDDRAAWRELTSRLTTKLATCCGAKR